MSCDHTIAERETACADGMCPLCLGVELERWRKAGHAQANVELSEENDRLIDEIKHFAAVREEWMRDAALMRAELHTERYTREQDEQTIRELCAEIERLTCAGIERLTVERETYRCGFERAMSENGELRQRVAELEDPHYLKSCETERDQLRALVKDLADDLEDVK